MKDVLARLTKLEAEAGAGESGPLVVHYGCTPETNPQPRPAGRSDAVLCLGPEDPLPAWAKGRPMVFIPAELGPNDADED